MTLSRELNFLHSTIFCSYQYSRDHCDKFLLRINIFPTPECKNKAFNNKFIIFPVKMPGEQTNVENKESTEGQQSININMESVNRIAKLPVVETTINAASNMYEKVKVGTRNFWIFFLINSYTICRTVVLNGLPVQ